MFIQNLLIMRFLSFVFAFCIASSSLFAQNDAISKYFDKYANDEDFTVVYVSPKMFELLGKLDLTALDEDEEEMELVKETVDQLKGVRVLTTEVDGMKRYQEAISQLDVTDYEPLVTVRDEGENVNLWVKTSGELIDELLVLVGGQDEFVLVSITGNIDLKRIVSLANSLDIRGMEHLDKVEESDRYKEEKKSSKKL